MSTAEIAAHVGKKLRQKQDTRLLPDFSDSHLSDTADFPHLPASEKAPEKLKTSLARDAARIVAGKWSAFGHLLLQVDDPPRWHKDYLAGIDLASTTSAFQLDHRELPKGADIKLVWELSRWYELMRLSQAAYVLKDQIAAKKCVRWLEDWIKCNPHYAGWNWTSALESGMRLIQFTWIDALLVQSHPELSPQLAKLRQQILPAHVWFTWRYKSFGSSANNHLLGELAGLILAQTRWPELKEWSADISELHRLFEREVLAQFEADGGNKEQALNYQLFSFEFCWQPRLALLSAGRKLSPSVEDRLQRAAEFFVTVQAESEFWDYGDSDSAFVTPLFSNEAALEWRDWLRDSGEVEALRYWIGAPPRLKSSANRASTDWEIYPESGIAIHRDHNWLLRFDLSGLGYLATAAHGHLDALHLSIWLKDVAFVIDPGTGAYYAEKELRTTLASWNAHNAPHPPAINVPTRLGPFLWSAHHRKPVWNIADGSLHGELELPGARMSRRITKVNAGWSVEDACGQSEEFMVNWQFAPGVVIKKVSAYIYEVERLGIKMEVRLSEAWHNVEVVSAFDTASPKVSSAFRKTERASALRLSGRGRSDHAKFQTTFLVP